MCAMRLQAGPVPKYYQLSEILREQIAVGDLPPDKQLPTEDDLCHTYGVSRGTVRRAMDVLENEGLIRREQGRGIFAESPRPSLIPFTLVEAINGQANTRTLAQDCIPATQQIAERLQVAVGEDAIHIAQTHIVNGRPTLYEERFLSRALCPNLLNEDLNKKSVHALLVEGCQLPLIRVRHTVEKHHLSAREAHLLDAEIGASAFFVDRVTDTLIDGKERPAVWYRAIYLGDEYQFLAAF